jgi:steroid 5-alpha reductase family enzyme
MAVPDVVFARLLMGIVLFEFFADQQQWNFQQAKKTYLKSAKAPSGYSSAALDRGFVTSGLWAYSRHPNFLAEQSVWVAMYLWSCWATGTYANWSAVGVLQYLGLFHESTKFSEGLSAGKYPEYKEYQKRVGKFFPTLVGAGVGDWNKADNEKKLQ